MHSWPKSTLNGFHGKRFIVRHTNRVRGIQQTIDTGGTINRRMSDPQKLSAIFWQYTKSLGNNCSQKHFTVVGQQSKIGLAADEAAMLKRGASFSASYQSNSKLVSKNRGFLLNCGLTPQLKLNVTSTAFLLVRRLQSSYSPSSILINCHNFCQTILYLTFSMSFCFQFFPLLLSQCELKHFSRFSINSLRKVHLCRCQNPLDRFHEVVDFSKEKNNNLEFA